MNILITGATGRVGSRIVPTLLTAGHNVRILVRQKNNTAVEQLVAKGAEPVIGDIMQPTTFLDAFSNVDAVIHLAAFFRSQDKEEIRRINVEGTKNVVEAAMRANKSVRFIFASTNLVYSNDEAPASESEVVSPTMPYPLSKVEAENYLLKLHAEQNLDVRILRFAFVYGQGDSHLNESGSLFERFKWHPAQRLHMVHHADIAQAVRLVLGQDNIGGEIYNVADDAPITAQEVLKYTEQNVTLIASTSPLQKPWSGLVATEKIHKIGFRPLVPSFYTARDLDIL